MKKSLLIAFFICMLCTGVFAQNIYVSANGNDSNDGLSETRAVKSLDTAVKKASAANGNVVVIGTLNLQSEGYAGLLNKWSFGAVFSISDITRELIITGKPNAAGSERAVLSGAGSESMVLIAANSIIRLEHIEISGGEGEYGPGIGNDTNASITLGQGAVVRDNALYGVVVFQGTFIIDGGEVRDNRETGVLVESEGHLILRGGYIRNNRSSGYGGGVHIFERGSFTMTGGTITGNAATHAGGGVYVFANGRFDQSGGTISGNTAGQGANQNIFRTQGSLGSNL